MFGFAIGGTHSGHERFVHFSTNLGGLVPFLFSDSEESVIQGSHPAHLPAKPTCKPYQHTLYIRNDPAKKGNGIRNLPYFPWPPELHFCIMMVKYSNFNQKSSLLTAVTATCFDITVQKLKNNKKYTLHPAIAASLHMANFQFLAIILSPTRCHSCLFA